MKALNYSTSGSFLQNENTCYLVFYFFNKLIDNKKSGEYIHSLYTFSACCLVLQSILIGINLYEKTKNPEIYGNYS
ncbi:hypothetical protein EUZ69_12535 [Enterococcus faecalis]|nr:hypothetical protein [Enterococcus faecalis]NFA95211.1 hypothetical protein [Enterococcus faecalis]